MAKSLEMEVIAEGVATVEQLNFPAAHGCFAVQGFLFSPPRPAAELPASALACRRQMTRRKHDEATQPRCLQ
jgi:EAL domain-containing protein (putative c-di-GMP-specific phosphodiesterase class I)